MASYESKYSDWISNLREVTISEKSHNTEEPLGYCKVGNKYRAAILIRGQRKHIGYFDTEEGAALAYKGIKDQILKLI